MQQTVQILLATYNGERFLHEQLDSLFNQTFQDFSVLVRDDQSTDNTLHIIQEYQLKYADKIKIITDEKKNVGATQNFNLLLANTNADYIFFCDQDDIWLPHKMEKSLALISTIEMDKNMPCLIYADMKSINDLGEVTAKSVWKQLHLSPKYFTLNRLLIQNIPHGCTMLINKAMRDMAFPIPETALLHDHWIALLAATCGQAIAIEEPLLLLRNHSENVTRKQTNFSDKMKRYSNNAISSNMYEYFIRIRVQQAKALQSRIGAKASEHVQLAIQNFIALETTKGLRRKLIFLQNKFYRTTFWHTFKMIVRA